MNNIALNFYEKGENFKKSLNYNGAIMNNERACELDYSNALVNLNNLYENNYDEEDFDSDSENYNENSETEENHILIKTKCKYSHKHKNKMFKLLLNYLHETFFK